MPGSWKILVIDDDQSILTVLSMTLEAAGYEVATAISGSETISRVNEFQPDLILLDWKFPPCPENHQSTLEDGSLIIAWLRGMSRAAKTPIIIVSGADPSEYRDRVRAYGVVDIFQKPFDTKLLLETIRTRLDSRSQPPAKPVESHQCW